MKRGVEFINILFLGETPCQDISLVSPYLGGGGGLLDEKCFCLVAPKNFSKFTCE